MTGWACWGASLQRGRTMYERTWLTTLRAKICCSCTKRRRAEGPSKPLLVFPQIKGQRRPPYFICTHLQHVLRLRGPTCNTNHRGLRMGLAPYPSWALLHTMHHSSSKTISLYLLTSFDVQCLQVAFSHLVLQLGLQIVTIKKSSALWGVVSALTGAIL